MIIDSYFEEVIKGESTYQEFDPDREAITRLY
jgi:hypothetical protein